MIVFYTCLFIFTATVVYHWVKGWLISGSIIVIATYGMYKPYLLHVFDLWVISLALFFFVFNCRLKKYDLSKLCLLSLLLLTPVAILPSTQAILNWSRLVELIIYTLLIMRVPKIEKLSYVLLVLLICLFLNLILSILQYFMPVFQALKDPNRLPTIGGFFNDSPELGPFIVIITVFLVPFFNVAKNWLVLALSGLGVLFSGNRTSLAAFVSYLGFKSRLLLLAICVLFATLFNYLPEKLRLLFFTLRDEPASILEFSTLGLRLDNWRIIIDYFASSCSVIFGCGYKFVETEVSPQIQQVGIFAVDNTFLRVFVEQGIIGVFILTFIFYLILRRSMSLALVLLFFSLTLELIESLPLVVLVSTLMVIYNKFANEFVSPARSVAP